MTGKKDSEEKRGWKRSLQRELQSYMHEELQVNSRLEPLFQVYQKYLCNLYGD